MSPDLQHAVIAAEDAHFYQHHGFDWHEIQIAAEDDLEGGRTRGSFHHYAATCKEPIFRNGPLRPPQGRGVYPGTGGRIRPRQAAHSGGLSQRG
ncbi:MAG: transglycosylase domain-containing protein [Candidatus Sulfotelmatobacter sp.]